MISILLFPSCAEGPDHGVGTTLDEAGISGMSHSRRKPKSPSGTLSKKKTLQLWVTLANHPSALLSTPKAMGTTPDAQHLFSGHYPLQLALKGRPARKQLHGNAKAFIVAVE